MYSKFLRETENVSVYSIENKPNGNDKFTWSDKNDLTRDDLNTVVFGKEYPGGGREWVKTTFQSFFSRWLRINMSHHRFNEVLNGACRLFFDIDIYPRENSFYDPRDVVDNIIIDIIIRECIVEHKRLEKEWACALPIRDGDFKLIAALSDEKWGFHLVCSPIYYRFITHIRQFIKDFVENCQNKIQANPQNYKYDLYVYHGGVKVSCIDMGAISELRIYQSHKADDPKRKLYHYDLKTHKISPVMDLEILKDTLITYLPQDKRFPVINYPPKGYVEQKKQQYNSVNRSVSQQSSGNFEAFKSFPYNEELYRICNEIVEYFYTEEKQNVIPRITQVKYKIGVREILIGLDQSALCMRMMHGYGKTHENMGGSALLVKLNWFTVEMFCRHSTCARDGTGKFIVISHKLDESDIIKLEGYLK